MIFSRLLNKTFILTFTALFIANLAYMQVPNVVITGKVTGYSPIGVVNPVTLVINGTGVDVTLNSQGEFSYTITGAPTVPFKIEFRNNKEFLNGVNVGDIIKIQNHILGKTQLDQPNKFIAADVKGDGGVSVSDIQILRHMILGKIDKFPSDKSWTFFDANYALTALNWSSAPQFIMYDPANPVPLHFKAVKTGSID